MDTKILSGKDVSTTTYQALQSRIKALKSQSVVPGLAVLLVGEDAGSQIYVRNKTKKFADLNLHSNTFQYSSSISQEDLLLKIRELNNDDRFHGILVQLPLPKHIDEHKVLRAMDPKKDVDGFHPFNLGLLAAGKPYFIPCTPKGIMRILAHYQINLSGKNVVVVNCNPETVSTDYDICKRLYFEELTFERILDITEFESPKGVVTSVGGQTANNLTIKLSNSGVKIFGTRAEDVDSAENRSKFSQVLDRLHIMQPAWQEFTNITDAKNFALEVGYPVLVRPSYVLSGAAMKTVWSQVELKKFATNATTVSPDHPVVITKFMLNALEVDVDGVCDGKNVIIGAIVEHIDSAGVHSGDAMMCIPPWRLSNKIIENILESTNRIAIEFSIKGPFNLQFLIKDDQAYVIELNIRASRSMPFVSKFIRTNLISLAAQAALGKTLPKITQDLWMNTGLYGIKVPQFSFMQLEGADIVLGVEMQSTGEAACFGDSFYDALSKGLESVGYNLPKIGSALVTIGGVENREKLLQTSALLKSLDFKILATETTAEFFKAKIGDVQIVHKISEPERKPNITDLLYEKKINFIINVPNTTTIEKYVGMLYDEYQIRRKALELGIPVLTTTELAESFVKTLAWLRDNETTKKPLGPYKDSI